MPSQRPRVSPNNPCPFLRALVAQGLLPDDQAPVATVARVVSDVAARGEGAPALPAPVIGAIALVANGLGPAAVARSALAGVRLDALRDGPLDKHGVGSGILDARGRVVQAQLKRLAEFASDKFGPDGQTEPGLDAAELVRMMDANAARAAGRRRAIDRRLMDGEWPVLLKVMGKPGRDGRYLSLQELDELFRLRRLPARMAAAQGRVRPRTA